MTEGWDRLSALASAGRETSQVRHEVTRILELPRKTNLPEEDLVVKWTGRLQRAPGARPLRPAQARLLEQCEWAHTLDGPYGVVGSVGVGKGKTLAFMLMPRVFQAKRPLLLIPSDVKEQTLEAEWEWGAEYNVVPTTDDVEEWRYANGDMRYIVTYGQLSRPDATALLRELQPDLIMADECQALANPRAARTMRFLRYMGESRGDTRFVPMSGTLTQAKLGDYVHLVNLALMDQSPMPLNQHDLERWSQVLDWGAEPDTAASLAVAPLVDWSQGFERTGDLQVDGRMALGERLQTAPGFVMTTSSSCDADLSVRALYPPTPATVTEALDHLSRFYELPDGTEVVEQTHFSANANHLSLGFYYIWDWEYGEPDEEWLEARRFWASEVRRYLARHAQEGRDSPFLVEQYVAREKAPAVLYSALERWRVQRKKDPPPVRSVWFDQTLVAEAVNWAHQRERCVIWFRSRAVGEMLEHYGVPAMWEGVPDAEATPRVALSLNVYHKGHELQAWDDQLLMEPPPNGAIWEQLLGRMHRQGQTSEHVKCDVFQHTWPLRNNFTKAREKSEYIQAMTYQPQKLLNADLENFKL